MIDMPRPKDANQRARWLCMDLLCTWGGAVMVCWALHIDFNVWLLGFGVALIRVGMPHEGTL